MGSGIGDVTGAMGNIKDLLNKRIGTSKDAKGNDVGGTPVAGLLAGGLGGAMPKQPPQQAAPAYNAPMLPFISPPPPAQMTNTWGGPRGPMDDEMDRIRGMPPRGNAFYGG